MRARHGIHETIQVVATNKRTFSMHTEVLPNEARETGCDKERWLIDAIKISVDAVK